MWNIWVALDRKQHLKSFSSLIETRFTDWSTSNSLFTTDHFFSIVSWSLIRQLQNVTCCNCSYKLEETSEHLIDCLCRKYRIFSFCNKERKHVDKLQEDTVIIILMNWHHRNNQSSTHSCHSLSFFGIFISKVRKIEWLTLSLTDGWNSVRRTTRFSG